MVSAQSFPLAITVAVPPSHWDGQLAADLFAPEGAPWLAVFDGVAEPREFTLGGHALLLTSNDGSTTAYYAHGLDNRVRGSVRAGQVIGYVGRSGNAADTPPHLHFAVGSRINDQGGGTVRPADWLGAAPYTASLFDWGQGRVSPWIPLALTGLLLLFVVVRYG